MKVYQGQSVSGGIAIGKVFYLDQEKKPTDDTLQSPREELEKFLQAHNQALLQIQSLIDQTSKEIGEEEAFIFEAHKMILQDLDFLDFIQKQIDQGNGALASIQMAEEYFSSIFSSMDDEYMRARSADIKDICMRLVQIVGGTQNQIALQESNIVIAKDLTPSQTLQIPRDYLLGFVTLEGSSSSHTAILAKTMGIPALVQAQIDASVHQKTAIIDGEKGECIVDPTPEILEKYQKLMESRRAEQEALQKFRGEVSITKSGRKILLYANAGNLDDIRQARDNDAEGIGLLRSEFLYLQRDNFPTEEEQFEFYKEALLIMGDKRVIVRTLDVGADKQIDYFGLEKEENPALGYRGIRICLDREEIFKVQLRALLRASVYGRLAIMFPMIISLWEIRRIKQILKEVQNELHILNHPFDSEIEIGIMIETPASALIAQDLAREVDFFSIGTNDLTQYTLALDRQNPKLNHFGDSYHPALLKLIDQTIQAGHQHNCWVGICGELAQEERAIELLIKKGIDELSIPPHLILSTRQKILNIF